MQTRGTIFFQSNVLILYVTILRNFTFHHFSYLDSSVPEVNTSLKILFLITRQFQSFAELRCQDLSKLLDFFAFFSSEAVL